MKNIQLRDRLQSVFDLVPHGMVLADVGTDHGFLPIKLVAEGCIPSAIAMDLREGPLDRAREHVKEYGLEDKIDIRLSDGLMKIEAGEVECLSISGMGGLNIEGILKARPDVVSNLKAMVLQPQSDIDIVRRLVYSLGFVISAERAVFSDNKYYFVMLCTRGQGQLSDIEALFGPCLLREKDETLYNYLLKEKRTAELILDNLSGADDSEKNQDKIREERAYLSLVNKAITTYRE